MNSRATLKNQEFADNNFQQSREIGSLKSNSLRSIFVINTRKEICLHILKTTKNCPGALIPDSSHEKYLPQNFFIGEGFLRTF